MNAAQACMPSGPPVRSALITILVAGALCGCAGDWVAIRGDAGTRLRQREHGWSIALPEVAGSGGAWRRLDLSGAELAFRNAEGVLLGMAARCRPTRARAEVLARQLRRGVERDRVLSSEAIERLGEPGWRQTWRPDSEGVHVRSVTWLYGGCVYDWLLVAPSRSGFERAEAVFERWWESFEPPVDARPDSESTPSELRAGEGAA